MAQEADDKKMEKTTATVTINGETVETEPGRMVIDVAEEIGVFVPRFCYHPGMKSVAVCRMCLVAVEGQRKLLPACATPVTDGMNVNTVEENAVDAQKGMLEFLLINHPLDCPVCDRGGECPLQDQTYQHGPGSSRYIEPKRTYEKPIEISNLVLLDRERCVLCWRCVRFADEVAGDQFIQLVDRGPGTQILTFKDDPFDSYFSGNTVQICPVGALTSKPYRFVSRPWDLKSSPSVCTYCSVGCPITNESRSEKLVRCQALPNENVNDFWVCDKGRYGYHHVDAEDRLQSPLLRGSDDEFELVSWGQAVEAVAEKIKGAKRVGVIAGGHLTTEDAFAIGRLARKIIKTPDIDSRIQDAGAPYELAMQLEGTAGSTATMNDLEKATSIVWVGSDPKESLPVLYLRLRKSVIDLGAKLAVVSPRRVSLDAFATHIARSEAGGEAAAVRGIGDGGVFELGERPVICWAPGSAGRDETATLQAVIDLAKATGAKVLIGPPHAGSQGLIDMGVHPGLSAGYRPAPEVGRDTRAILEAAATGDIDVLLVFGADLINDFPDAALAERALGGNAFTMVCELFPTDTVAYADAVFPSTAYAEREGTFTNLERRLQKLEANVPPPGSSSEPWKLCARIAQSLGDRWTWRDFYDVWATIKKEVPSHADVDLDMIDQPAPSPHENLGTGFAGDRDLSAPRLAGPGGQYPKGFRQGAPFQTGQNWPLSWEIRAFEARQRPGVIPQLNGNANPTERPADADATPAPGSPTEDRFVLYSGRHIYDDGAMISKTAHLRPLTPRAYVQMSFEDADRMGISEGDELVVATDGFEARLPARIGDVAVGAVFVPYDQPGLHGNRLIDGVNPTVMVTKP
ncbi:MAG: NADH-quinone oxidoreductase subunit NuoG [Actinomycetota bacterium]|nr:NADH-quinone oxidoreductase subunit NuoG [Actinomycetota bacterium]